MVSYPNCKKWDWKPYLEGKTLLLQKEGASITLGLEDSSALPCTTFRSTRFGLEFSLNRECVNQLAAELAFESLLLDSPHHSN